MKLNSFAPGAALVAVLAVAADARVYRYSFHSGSNDSSWAFYQQVSTTVSPGGNAGGCLRGSARVLTERPLYFQAPDLAHGEASPFIGNYTVRSITNLSFDLQLESCILNGIQPIPSFGPEITVTISTNGGTTEAYLDDAVLTWTVPAPFVNDGWIHFDIPIDATSATAPAGWRVEWFNPAPWSELLRHVTQVRIGYPLVCTEGCPETFADVTLAIDNIELRSDCAADVDDGWRLGDPDGAVDTDDLIAYLDAFVRGDPRADLDNGTFTWTLDDAVNIEDLLYFLERYAAGC